MHPFIETQKTWMRSDLPPFRSGDTLRVNVRVKEGESVELLSRPLPKLPAQDDIVIRHLDEHIVVVEKPAGHLARHSGSVAP